MRLRALLIPAAALSLAACGGGGDGAAEFEGEQRAVAETVQALQTAAEEGDARRICADLLAEPVLERLEDRGCQPTVAAAIDDADAFTLEVEDVRVRGREATARVRAAGGESARTERLRLVREGARWKLAELGGGAGGSGATGAGES